MPSSPYRSSRTAAALGRLAAAVATVVLVLVGAVSWSPAAWASEQVFVSPSGSDADAGTEAAPWRTLAKGLSAVRPGQTLVVRGGTYAERLTSVALTPGTASSRVQVVAYPGERPVVQGLLWLKGASYWDVRGINVTWSSANSASEHMVKLSGGTGWTFTDAEVWGARSYAAILVAGDASGWTVARNHVHDTWPSNSTNQDHLIYANSGTGGGVIERNLLVGSSNGRAVKIGPPSATSGVVENVVIRYNTMVDNLGPSNVQLAWGSSNVQVYRNIMVRPASSRSAVTAYQLTGTGNVVSDNLVWDAVRPMDTGVAGLTDGGGNFLADPQLSPDGRTSAPAAASFGRHAPVASGSNAAPTRTAVITMRTSRSASVIGYRKPVVLAARVLADGRWAAGQAVVLERRVGSGPWYRVRAGVTPADGLVHWTLYPDVSGEHRFRAGTLVSGLLPVAVVR